MATGVAFLPVGSVYAQQEGAADQAETNEQEEQATETTEETVETEAEDESIAQTEEDATEPEPPVDAPTSPPATPAGAVAAAEPLEEGPEELLITGSRIKRKEIATAAPVTVITKEDLLSIGRTSVEDILQRLPSNANALGTQFNNGGNGASRVSLRSLGPERTLVLLNGRRFVPGGDGANSSVDLNSIPVSIIERVEVLLDGASAAYGSDAVAGVINIITRTDFAGVEANAYSGIAEAGDGRIYQIDITGGVSSEKGNITFSAMLFDQQPIFAADRDFADQGLGYDFETDTISPSGSSFTPQGTIQDAGDGRPGNAAWEATGCSGGLCFNDPEVGWRPFGDDTYNFQPDNYVRTPSRRISFFSQGSYELSEYFGVFFEAGFTNRASNQLLAPNPLGPGIFNGITVSAQNRFNPFGRDFGDVRRRVLEAGNRVFTQDSNTFRIVVGARGNIPDLGFLRGWTWEGHGNFGRTETINTLEGEFNAQRLALALGPDSQCTGGCVPLDLFSGAGGLTQEMLDYVSYTGVDRGFTEQNIAELNLSGPLFELVEGNPVALAFGYQFRDASGADVPNPLIVQGDATGNTRGITRGGFEVHAGYFELSVPLLGDLPGVELLEVSASGRVVDFDTFGGNFAYKFGARWQPIKYAALRGTYSTAFRAPSIAELFQPQADSFITANDPCSAVPTIGSLDDPTIAANCAADLGSDGGIPVVDTQIRTKIGGNPDLDPETAVVYTAGVVLDGADLVRGLTLAVDYYNIDIEDAIQAIGTPTILSGCYASQDRQFCDLIERNPMTGIINQVLDTNNNVGGFKAEGIDFDLRYTTPSPFGRFGAGVQGTVLLTLEQTQATGFVQSYKGNFDQGPNVAGGSNPEYRLNAYVRWAMDWINGGMNFRYLPSFKECDGPCSTPDGENPVSRDVDSWFYMDLFAGVTFDTMFGGTELQLGINNLTNVEPPFIASAPQPRIDPANYDFIGRQYYARLTHRF